MVKEYKTIEEVAGPLMLVRKVDGVKYDELGEIERRTERFAAAVFWKLTEPTCIVQLFESAAGIKFG